MKVCTNCRGAFDESLAFCPHCGTLATRTPVYHQPPAKEPISIGGWIGRTLIPCIPLVGGIVYLIMLFIWSGDTKKEDTFRNWAKAQLIVTAVVLVLTIVFVLVFGASFAEVMNSL